MPRTRGLSVRFYTKVFDLELVGEGTGTVQSMGQPVEVRQALLSTPGRQDLLALTHAASIPIGSAGLNHIGFFFEADEDVRIAIEAVSRAMEEKSSGKESAKVRFSRTLRNPDGYRIEMSTQPIVLSAGRDKSQDKNLPRC